MVKSRVVSICVGALYPLSSISSLHAQAESANTAKEATPDYGKAVDMLIGLGFPDTKDCVYKSINAPMLSNRSSYSMSSSNDRVPPPKMKGNGWLTAGENPKVISTIDASIQAYKETDSPNYSRDGEPVQGKSSDADVLEDMKAATKWLIESSSGYTQDHYWNYGGKQTFSQYFILACQAYRNGHKAEANELLATLFRLAPAPEELVDNVISSMADARLELVTQKFQQSKDWKAYHQDLTELQKTFSRGWPHRYALAILIPKVEKRALGNTPPMPKLEGINFTPQVAQILKQTATDGQQISFPNEQNYYYGEEQGSPIWLLDEDKKHNPSDPPFQQLTQLGMDGFIGLTSLLDDDTLVLVDRGRSYYRSSRSYYSSYSDTSEIQLAEQLYASMDRPMSRGEIAKAYIKQCVPELTPNSYDSDTDYSNEDIKAMALAFWRSHKDDKQLDLLKYYLGSGNPKVVSTVARSLLNKNTPEGYSLFENAILASSTPSLYANEVKSYVLKRRQQSKEFLERYKKNLISELGPDKTDSYENNGQYMVMQDGGAEKFIEKLMRFTENLKPSQLLVRLSRADDNTEETLEMLGAALEGKPIGEFRAKFAYAAAKGDDAKAEKILSFLYQQDLSATADDGQNKEQDAKAGFHPPMSDFETQDWLNLLDRTAKSAGRDEYSGDVYSISQLAGLLVESIADPDYDDELFDNLYTIIGSDASYQIYVTRSKARLKGETIPPLPSKDDVSEDRQKELIAQLKASDAAKVLEILDRMSVSERLVFADYLENNDAPESYTATKDYITEFDSSRAPQLEATKKAEATLKTLLYAKKLDAETIKQVLPKLSEHQADLAGYSFSISRSRERLGYCVYIFSSSMMKMRIEALQALDKEIKEKKHEHYVSLLLNPSSDEESNIVIHGATEISKDDVTKIVSTLEELSQGYFNAGFTVENQASIEAAEKNKEANKDERETIITAILEKTNGAIKREVLDQMDLDSLKMIQKQIMD